MIVAVGTVPESTRYKRGSFEHFQKWVVTLSIYQLDIETTMTKWWCDKEIITIQFGDIAGKTQCVLHWNSLTTEQKEWVKTFLRDKSRRKVIHSAQFEYVVLRFHGVIIENIYDTLLAEKILYGGDVIVDFYGLKFVAQRYLGEDLDKSQQTTFSHEPLTEEQVVYAADDVRVLGAIKEMQEADPRYNVAVADLEFEALLTYSDMTYYGMPLDKEAWLKNLDLVEPIIQAAERDLYDQMLTDTTLQTKAIELGYLVLEDEILINWNSPPQKLKLLKILDPEITGSSKAMLQKLIKDRHYASEWLQHFVDGATLELERLFVNMYREELIEADLLRPAGHVYLNWNSQPQVLPLFRAVDKKLTGLSEEDLGRFTHPIGKKLREYKEALKLKTTYGESFIEQYVEPDGRVRTNYNQIVSTGRTSSANPNLQNIPAKESVGSRYRNCFIAPPGFKVSDCDYSSQEICVIAYLSKDPVWLEALAKNQDIHSVCTEMVFPEKWKAGTEEGCAFYAPGPDGKSLKKKCNCKKHKYLRSDTKPVTFGLAYGLSEYKLSGDLGISIVAAKAIIDAYFAAFPRIASILNHFAKYGLDHGYIMTIHPFFRKRYFPYWKELSTTQIQMHQAGIQFNSKCGQIERASKNAPIQGCSSDMVKVAACMMRKFIHEQGLQDKIMQVVHVHDQISCFVVDELAEWWSKEHQRIMEEAALVIVPTGIIKAEAQVTDVWSK